MHLHSNMVRFIIIHEVRLEFNKTTFTFQYGQIYYDGNYWIYNSNKAIYIPIWLDLLYVEQTINLLDKVHLHSNMVRFIISKR